MVHNVATGHSIAVRRVESKPIACSPDDPEKSASRGPSIAIVIVNYNTRRALQLCLNSVESGAATEVIVVDNASPDSSAEMVRREYPWVKLHANQSNIGYGVAANQGIAGCTARYILLLNADTILQPGALDALADYLDRHPRAAVVGPRLIDADGTLQASCYPFPTPLHTFLENSTYAVMVGRFIRRHIPVIGTLYLRTWPHDSARPVPWVKGAAIAIRRAAFEAAGGFDEAFFMYFEDADLCHRLNRAGWQIHFAPVTTITHLGAASTRWYRRQMAEQLLASTLKYYQKHASARQTFATALLVKNLLRARWASGKLRFYLTLNAKKRRTIAKNIAASQRLMSLWDGRPDSATLVAVGTPSTSSCD